MSKELSALMDGELELHEEPAVWAGLQHDDGLRDTWNCYRLIGDALRGEPRLDADLTARVAAELRVQPVVLMPRRRERRPWHGHGLGLAASAAGVAVVGWLAWGPLASTPEPIALARTTQTAPVAAQVRNMNEYLVAHQVHAPGIHLHGGSQHIRTVAASGIAP